jgi:23S rRNA pseudouridine1911/1915/1917 synthase
LKNKIRHNPAITTFRREVIREIELMKFLIDELPHKSRDNIKTLLRDGQVLVNRVSVSQFNHLLQPGQVIEINQQKIGREKTYRGLTILFEDSWLIVIDKHAGILSISDGKEEGLTAFQILSDHVKHQDPDNKIFIVHRLDRDTSGVLIFAKDETVQQQLQDLWKDSKPERTYIAVVEGKVSQPEGIMESYLKENKAFVMYSTKNPDEGQLAITRFRTLKSNDEYSLMEIKLETGRKNQIRVHMKDLGHSIVGDKKYGATLNPIGRLGLHASAISFVHPVTHQLVKINSAVPRKFLRLF